MNNGKKHDQDKPQVSLIFNDMPRALLEVSKVGTFGASKYSKGNWLKVNNGIDRYKNALDRHRLQAEIKENDDESDLSHMAHLAWNALAVLELKLREVESEH